MKQLDWARPQRQPFAGLAIVFLNTLWQLFKRVWPLLILMVLGGGKEGTKVNRYEIIGLALLVFTIIGAVFRFMYFRFYIEENKLIIKQGWLKKEMNIIPLERIQTVHIEQGPLHQLLGIVKLSIDTAGSQKTEASINALHKQMAEALKTKLLTDKQVEVQLAEKDVTQKPETILQLTDKDILKLSLSANHIETFFLLLSFGFGLYENLNNINNNLFSGIEELLPRQAIYPILFLMVAMLLITILISTARIFFKFYHFKVSKTKPGFQIKSGLFTIKERLISFKKIQFVSWKASWLRKLFGLWLLEYHIAGSSDIKQNQKVQLPVTQAAYIPALVNEYHLLPKINNETFVRMEASFVARRLLIAGLLPSAFIIPASWFLWNQYALLFLLYPLLILIVSLSVQKKFCLWALEDVLYIKKGIFGEERIILEWHKLQSIQLSQSIYQRKNGLASIAVYTAAGNIFVNFISLSAARQIVNFALYKTEALAKGWL